MPNGGSDCCGTCKYNAKNKGEPGYKHRKDLEPAICNIRNLSIETPFYTYCANHNYRNPEGIKIPIGPVLVDNHTEKGREIWVKSSDTEEIRGGLLELLRNIQEQPDKEYYGVSRDEVVIWQLGEFKEKRAVPDLERIITFNPSASADIGHSRARTIEFAKEALTKINLTT